MVELTALLDMHRLTCGISSPQSQHSTRYYVLFDILSINKSSGE